MFDDDMPWTGPAVLRAPTWLRRITAMSDNETPVRFGDIVDRFRCLEHLSAPLDADADVTAQLEALVAKHSKLRSLELTYRREGVDTTVLSPLSLDHLGASAAFLRDAVGEWSAGLAGIRQLMITSREPTRISDAKPWARLGACENLDLRRLELDKPTLNAIAGLPRLRTLKLSMCNLKAGALAALGQSPALERLTAIGIALSGSDAKALAQAGKLRAVVAAVGEVEHIRALRPLAEAGVALGLTFLPRTDLTDELLTAICTELPGLAGLRLRQVSAKKLSADSLAQLGNLRALRWLDCAGIYVRKLKAAHFGFLSELDSLRSLSLRDISKVSASVVGSLPKGANFQMLDLRGVPLSDAAAKKLSKLNIQRLAVGETKIGPKGVAALTAMPSLQVLSLGHAKGFTDEMLAAIAPNPGLQRLDLAASVSASVHPTTLEPLAKLPKLRSLGVVEVGLSDQWVESLTAAPALESLRFTRSDFSFAGGTVTDAGVEAGCRIPSLKTISHWSFVPSQQAQTKIEAAGCGAWTPADYRSLDFDGPADAPIEPPAK